MFLGIDPLYIFFVALPALALGAFAHFKLKSAYKSASKIGARSGITGADAARHILNSHGLNHVGIEMAQGHLSDHYDPKHKVLRLSPDVFQERSLAALGIAAHEAGHAIQDAKNYAPLVVRNAIVPVASFGSNMSFVFIFLGTLLSSFNLIVFGVALFATLVVFQLINLPVEFDASARAKAVLTQTGMVSTSERSQVEKVLNAAALTYVAATVSAVLTLLYYLFRLGLLGGQQES